MNTVVTVGVFVRFNFKITSCTLYDGAHNCLLQIIDSFAANLIVLKRKLDYFLRIQVGIDRKNQVFVSKESSLHRKNHVVVNRCKLRGTRYL